jgi:hypothetical protein
LDAKSGKGGLYSPGHMTKTTGEDKHHHENLQAPSLSYFDLHMKFSAKFSLDTVHARYWSEYFQLHRILSLSRDKNLSVLPTHFQ